MKFSFGILALLVVSAFAAELKPRPIDYEQYRTYVYEYVGNVLTGIPFSSSLYSGTQLKSDVGISHIQHNRNNLYTLKLSNVTFSSLIDEVTDPSKARFYREETLEQKAKKTLQLTVQYHVNNETQHLEWLEVHQLDEPWSLNIKKAIIEMFLVDIAGKQLKLHSGHESRSLNDEAHHSFEVYEPTSKGECETMYQVVNALPEFVQGPKGIEKFYWKVMKTRNFQNCTSSPKLTQHNWERKGCIAHCEQALKFSKSDMHNHYSAEGSQCNCDEIEAEPLDQQATTTYYIECRENPYILYAENNGKVVFDNHGTKFVSFTNQTLTFQRVHGGYNDPLNSKLAIRVSNLTFSLYPYAGSISQTHEIPVYNLLVPRIQHEQVFDDTVALLNKVAEAVVGMSDENQRNMPGFMTRIIQNLAHLDSEYIMRIYREYAMVPVEKLYSNTIESVRRQLFLDAITHVGTTNVSQWLEQVLESESEGLYPMETRQVIETLPLNVYAPTRSLIELLKRKMTVLVESENWDQLSAYVVAYGKLIAKACPNTGVVSDYDNEIHFIPIRSRSSDWLIPDNEKCTREQTVEYIEDLVKMLEKTNVIRGKLLIAQALAHTGKTLALEALTPYARGGFKCPVSDVSDCTFFRTSVIYALHHMIPVEPKRIRYLVLPIFTSKTESYELRLAAFDVFISTGPKRSELDSVAVSLHDENNLQVISMVRSILEQTANLTNSCDQQLAQDAREIIATLPEVNLDGLYSKASYNEWYSTDKSTGFFAKGQFVANNLTIIPRHGYLNIGSHWKSLSNSWFTLAFQQKGLETALKKLLNSDGSTFAFDPKTIDELWTDRGIVSRAEDEFKLRLFVRVYEQTSIFTMDKNTLQNAYSQFLSFLVRTGIDASNNKVDLNLVRFFMPSTYTDVVPSAIGLPIVATKQNPQIVSLRMKRFDFRNKRSLMINEGAISFQFTPQIFTESYSSLSVFNQGIRHKTNYGVSSLAKFAFYVPLNLGFEWNLKEKLFEYAIKPVFNKNNFHKSNTNSAFINPSFIGRDDRDSGINKEIQSSTPIYHHPLMQFKSRELGMNLNLGLSTERPWFLDLTSIPCDGTFAWLLEKYNEMNQFNNNINLTLVRNEDFPSIGITGYFKYEQDIGGNFEHIGERNSVSNTVTKKIGEELTQEYTSVIENPAFFARSLETRLETLGHPIPTIFRSRLTLIRAADYHAYWYRFNSTLDNKNETLWTSVPRRFVVEGKLERIVLPSDLRWQLKRSGDINASYKTKISWSDDVKSEQVDTKIIVHGLLTRTRFDSVIPEMERESWFHKQCERDIENGNATNYACELLAAQQSYFNHIYGKIQYENVEEPVRRSIKMAYNELKRSLINYWKPWSTISIKDDDADKDVVTFEAAYSNLIDKRPLVNLFVQTPTEKVNFTKLFVPVAPFPTLLPMEYLKASSLPKDQTCTVMKDSIRTFNNVTYRTWIDECEFVVAMDCSLESKKFAVTVKGKAGKRSIRIFTPLQTYLRIRDVKKDSASLTVHGIDHEQQGSDYVLRSGKPAIHLGDLPNSRHHEAHQVFMQDGVVNVILPSENVRVAFDGYYLKVTTSPLYIGKTCGLCGNQNQEYNYEFLDPKMNDLASNLTAFRDSYALHQCSDPNPCRGNDCMQPMVHLNHPIASFFWDSDKKATVIPSRETIVIQRSDMNCFSKYPQKKCKKDQKALKTESVEIDMVCLEKSHPLFDQWTAEAEKRVIHEISTLYKTETYTHELPVECTQ